jgi:predicted porin
MYIHNPQRIGLNAQSFVWLAVGSLLLLSPAHAEDAASAEPDSEVVLDEAAAIKINAQARGLGKEGDDVVKVDAPEIPDDEIEEVKTMDLRFYGSARIRFSASDNQLRISDNRSRIGVAGYKYVNPHTDIFTKVELGTDLGGDLNDVLLPPENPRDTTSGALFLRVGLVGVGTKMGDFSLGKQWSTYYNVSGYTDRFAVFGAKGTGTYNAGTDGGGSGTGRVDRAFKYQSRGKKLSLGLQLQDDGNITLADNQNYAAGGGASLTYDFSSQWSAGAAYNHATIDNLNQELLDLGLTGDSQAAVIGLQYAHEPIYVATTFTRHKNHEATNEDKYIDSDGWELYGRYQFSRRLRAVGGANYLQPDSDDPQAGQYKIRSAILGLQLTYSDISFGDIVYFEAELNNGRNVDGEKTNNAYTIGFRYSFEL